MNHLVRDAAGEPAGTLVLLHGRGADERDLLGLMAALDPQRRLRGITVGGPLRLPPGGKHWYVVERIGYPDEATFAATYRELASFLDEDLAVDWSTTVVGGFSQGGVMAYALGLGAGRPQPAGILALSSFIPTVDGWQPDLSSRRDLHVAHTHGSFDDVIDISFARTAKSLLEGAGLPLLFREFPGAHQIDVRLLPELEAWLAARFD